MFVIFGQIKDVETLRDFDLLGLLFNRRINYIVRLAA